MRIVVDVFIGLGQIASQSDLFGVVGETFNTPDFVERTSHTEEPIKHSTSVDDEFEFEETRVGKVFIEPTPCAFLFAETNQYYLAVHVNELFKSFV